jgi:hexokinase
MTVVSDLNLSLGQLKDVADALTQRIEHGLAAPGQEIKALPSFFGAPNRDANGKVLVIDTGGTNMRAAVVEVDGGSARITHGPLKKTLPVREGEKLSGAEFFRAQAELACEIAAPAGLPVGYCFSYPSENSPDRDSRLLSWTKGIDIPGVEGTLVGSQLAKALRDCGATPGPVRVLNDTVASMLGGALVHHDVPSERCIGLIVGTGNNMAAFFGRDKCPRIAAGFAGKMAINLESGNFAPPHLSSFDDAVDAASVNPGAQRFEKAVSGFYLPFVFEKAVPNHPGFDPDQGTSQLVALRTDGQGRPRDVATALLTRSADLVAASLAGVIALYDPSESPIGILAEGTFFWGYPDYAPRVRETLARLLPQGYHANVLKTEDANLIGSAVAALEA